MLPLLLVSAVVRCIGYTLSGAYQSTMLVPLALAIPGLIVGIFLGNRLFFKISQTWFSRIVGTVITLSGIKLLMR